MTSTPDVQKAFSSTLGVITAERKLIDNSGYRLLHKIAWHND